MSLGVVDEAAPLRALASPVRLRILSLLTGAAMSAAEVSRELGIAHASASYHLRQLADVGLLEIAERRSVRGGQERRYRHDPASGAALSGAHDGEARRLAFEALVVEMRRRLEAVDHHANFSDAEFWVDPDVWDDVTRRVNEAMVLLHDAALRPRAEGSVHVSATTVLFGMTP